MLQTIEETKETLGFSGATPELCDNIGVRMDAQAAIMEADGLLADPTMKRVVAARMLLRQVAAGLAQQNRMDEAVRREYLDRLREAA